MKERILVAIDWLLARVGLVRASHFRAMVTRAENAQDAFLALWEGSRLARRIERAVKHPLVRNLSLLREVVRVEGDRLIVLSNRGVGRDLDAWERDVEAPDIDSAPFAFGLTTWCKSCGRPANDSRLCASCAHARYRRHTGFKLHDTYRDGRPARQASDGVIYVEAPGGTLKRRGEK